MTALLIIIGIILIFNGIEASCDARIAELDRSIIAQEHEEKAEKRHKEVMKGVKKLSKGQEKLLDDFEAILLDVRKLPKANVAECEEIERYIKMAKDGSYEAYQRVRTFVCDKEWEKYV